MPEANLFNPFGSQPQYEDRLTWAFLVALKYDPLLQTFLRELVESRLSPNPRESRNAWESARVSTQTSGIDSRANRLVSVLLTDEAGHDVAVSWSDRDAVYDGVIEYTSGLTLIVENKLDHGDVWEKQCRAQSQFLLQRKEIDLGHHGLGSLKISELLLLRREAIRKKALV